MSNDQQKNNIQCDLLHHGVAANSSPKVIACLPITDNNNDTTMTRTELVYASNLMLNIIQQKEIPLNLDENNDNNRTKVEKVWTVTETLRTCTSTEAESATAAANVSTLTAKRVITCVVPLKQNIRASNSKSAAKNNSTILVCGFSDGTITCWYRHNQDWKEQVLPDLKSSLEGRSITGIDGYYDSGEENGKYNISIVACSSGGAHFFGFQDGNLITEKRIVSTPSNVVKYHVLEQQSSSSSTPEQQQENDRLGIFLVGTAAPRHNKIHVLVAPSLNDDTQTIVPPVYSGSLTGHEDWITCFDWTRPAATTGNNTSNCSYLASGSQDAKIRLWKWVTTTTTTTTTTTYQ